MLETAVRWAIVLVLILAAGRVASARKLTDADLRQLPATLGSSAFTLRPA